MNHRFIKSCSKCRKPKPIVKRLSYLAYCADCAEHMPTVAQFDDYNNPTKRVSTVRVTRDSRLKAARADAHNRGRNV